MSTSTRVSNELGRSSVSSCSVSVTRAGVSVAVLVSDSSARAPDTEQLSRPTSPSRLSPITGSCITIGAPTSRLPLLSLTKLRSEQRAVPSSSLPAPSDFVTTKMTSQSAASADCQASRKERLSALSSSIVKERLKPKATPPDASGTITPAPVLRLNRGADLSLSFDTSIVKHESRIATSSDLSEASAVIEHLSSPTFFPAASRRGSAVLRTSLPAERTDARLSCARPISAFSAPLKPHTANITSDSTSLPSLSAVVSARRSSPSTSNN
eukprot:1676306-Pleurochrysis_carterae.AAC.2